MILAGDVGGTKVLLALFEEKNGDLNQVEEASFASREYPNLEAILDDFLGKDASKIERACLGVPGPVFQGKCRTTHFHWLIDAGELKKRLGVEDVFLINDMAALAYAVPFLPARQFEVLQEGATDERTRFGLIAAGTGLGQSFIVSHKKEFIVLASEGGHSDFAPRNGLEMELLRFLLQKYERVSVERVLSGAGLFHIYQFIVERFALRETELPQDRDPAETIASCALAKQSPACEKALDLFVSIYGAVAGNMALQLLAGIYVGGGIAPKVISKIKEGFFMESFLAKGRFKTLLSRVPVKVILNEQASLIGAAYYAMGGAISRLDAWSVGVFDN
ncbi:MAG: glucokinase [Nitrospinales bacterium]